MVTSPPFQFRTYRKEGTDSPGEQCPETADTSRDVRTWLDLFIILLSLFVFPLESPKTAAQHLTWNEAQTTYPLSIFFYISWARQLWKRNCLHAFPQRPLPSATAHPDFKACPLLTTSTTLRSTKWELQSEHPVPEPAMEHGEPFETFHHNRNGDGTAGGIIAGIMLQVNGPMSPNCPPFPEPLGGLAPMPMPLPATCPRC